MSSVVSIFLNERKEEWLKKKITASMSDLEKTEKMQEAQEKYSLATWLPDAAKRAGQLSMATHPGKFSHPSAKISAIIAESKQDNDGYLRTGNVDYPIDIFGNAAVMDVHKFLSLTLDDGESILQHLEKNTSLIQDIFTIPTADFDDLKQGLLAIKESNSTAKTDGLVKQVYFPVEVDYHLLSVLTPSGMLNKLKGKLDEMRFGETTKEAKECRKKENPHPVGYDDIYDLTVTAYGGTKPQNISVLNSKNGGVAYLLPSWPPVLKRRNVRLPTSNFFTNTLWYGEFKESFHSLHALMKGELNNKKIRDAVSNILKYIIDQGLQRAFQVRAFAEGWSDNEHYHRLPMAQRIWLDDIHRQKRKDEDQWIASISKSFALWIIQSYEKTLKNDHIKLGDEEMKYIRGFAEQAINDDKEFFK